MDPIEVSEGIGLRGGETIQIGAGWQQFDGCVPSIYLADEAWCFVEPIVARVAANYGPDSRWGVTEIASPEWRLVVAALRAFAAQLGEGQLLSSDDFVWIYTVDLDKGVEIKLGAFARSYNEDRAKLAAVRDMLIKVADWVDRSLQAHLALTVYGY